MVKMASFDYSIEAQLASTASEISPSSIRRGRVRQPVGYGRFARAADAIRFAIEELPAKLLPAAQLKVAGERFDCNDIRRLYESDQYPFTRRVAAR
jgi:Arc/MetJ-type ribon-helix-helix transcriptional regulator